MFEEEDMDDVPELVEDHDQLLEGDSDDSLKEELVPSQYIYDYFDPPSTGADLKSKTAAILQKL